MSATRAWTDSYAGFGSGTANFSEERAFGHGFRSLCALPLVIRGKSIGAITVGSITKNRYSEADADFLMDVASQIAIAIDNMRAHEETEALKARFQAEAVYLQEEIKTEHNFEEIIGQSAPVQQLLRNVEQVAPTEATVLIQGETGTGKELIARLSMTGAAVKTGRWLKSTAVRFRRDWSRANCSVMKKAPSPGRRSAESAGSNWPMAGRSFSMRSRSCRLILKSSYFACSRKENLNGSAAAKRLKWMCG